MVSGWRVSYGMTSSEWSFGILCWEGGPGKGLHCLAHRSSEFLNSCHWEGGGRVGDQLIRHPSVRAMTAFQSLREDDGNKSREDNHSRTSRRCLKVWLSLFALAVSKNTLETDQTMDRKALPRVRWSFVKGKPLIVSPQLNTMLGNTRGWLSSSINSNTLTDQDNPHGTGAHLRHRPFVASGPGDGWRWGFLHRCKKTLNTSAASFYMSDHVNVIIISQFVAFVQTPFNLKLSLWRTSSYSHVFCWQHIVSCGLCLWPAFFLNSRNCSREASQKWKMGKYGFRVWPSTSCESQTVITADSETFHYSPIRGRRSALRQWLAIRRQKYKCIYI